MEKTQLTLVPDAFKPSPVRVVALAGIIAGMRWPGSDSFASLSRKRQQAAILIATDALTRIAEAE